MWKLLEKKLKQNFKNLAANIKQKVPVTNIIEVCSLDRMAVILILSIELKRCSFSLITSLKNFQILSSVVV